MPAYTLLGAHALGVYVWLSQVGALNITETPSLVEDVGFVSIDEALDAAPFFVLFQKGSRHPWSSTSLHHVELVQWVNRLSDTAAQVTSVVTATPQNFERLTAHPRKHVLVEFYTEW